MATKHASLGDFAKGTVLNEADVEIVGAKFTEWDYRGKSAVAVPALQVDLRDANGDVHEQFYSVGSAEEFAPSKDGKAIDIIGTRERIHEQSNYARFMNALFTAGWNNKYLDNDDIGCLVGTRGHVGTQTVKRSGGTMGNTESTILLFDRVDSMPNESGSGAGAAAGNNDEARDTANQLVLSALAEANGELPRKNLLTTVMKSDEFKSIEDKGLKTAVLNLVKLEEFIAGSEDWTLDKGVIKLS